MSLKILYLCADRGIPIRGHKGAAVHVRAIANAFARTGNNVTIMTPKPGPENGSPLSATLVEIPLPRRNGNGLHPDQVREQQAQAYSDLLFEAACGHLQQERYDFIYERYSLWSDVGARLASATGLPLVLEVNAPLRQEADRYRHLFDQALAEQVESTQFTSARAIAVVSEPLQDYVIGQGTPADKVHVLPNGIDPHYFHPAVRGGSVHARYALSDKIVVGFVGRPRPWHDLETLLRAMQQLHEADSRYHLLMVGQMPEDLPQRLAAFGLQHAVTLVDPVPHKDIPAYIAAMDVAVAPQLLQAQSYFSPLKLFEYLACGVPTVAANVGQSSSIIDDGATGLLYEAGSADSLVDKIRTYVENPAYSRQIAWQGAARVLTEYTWERNAEKVLDLIAGETGETLAGAAPALPILDRKLRQRLYRATRPDLAAPFLARALRDYDKKRFKHVHLAEVESIEVLKYKPGRRCVLAYTFANRRQENGTSKMPRIIGKVFRDERGRRLHALQENLWHHGFGPDSEDDIYVSQSLGFAPKMRMQLQERAPGHTLNELLVRQDITPLMPRAAQALARLHNWPGPFMPAEDKLLRMRSYLLQDEVDNLGRFKENLRQSRPQSTDQVDFLYGRLISWADELPEVYPVKPIHRDFYYSQLLFDHNRVTIIDFDLFSMGDPALDAANFYAHLHFLALDILSDARALDDAAALFLDSYAGLMGHDDAFFDRFAFYEAATFFRLLNVVAPRPGLVHLFDDIYARTRALVETGLTG